MIRHGVFASAGLALCLVGAVSPRDDAGSRSPDRASVSLTNQTNQSGRTVSRDRDWSTQHREHILAVVQDLQSEPFTQEQMKRLQEASPGRLQRLLNDRNARTILMLARIRADRPELYELRVSELTLDRRARDVAREMNEARSSEEPADAAGAEQRLRAVLAEQYEIGLKARRKELELLEQQVDDLRSDLLEQEQDRERVIDQRFLRHERGGAGAGDGSGRSRPD